jgi:hypothetical protein
MTESSRSSNDLPIACTLTPEDLLGRRAGLLANLAQAADEAERTGTGYRFRFAASSATLAMITAVIDAERQCCRFLRFQLTVEPDLGAFSLDVSGPAGTAPFLADLLQP